MAAFVGEEVGFGEGFFGEVCEVEELSGDEVEFTFVEDRESLLLRLDDLVFET